MKPKGDAMRDDANLNKKIQKTGELLHVCSQPLPQNSQLLWTEHLTIRRILAEISAAENFSSETTPPRGEFLAPFEKWCSKMGILAEKIKISVDDDQNFGLYAHENLNVESILAEIPSKAVFSCNFAKKSDLKLPCEKDPILKAMPNVILSISILNEKLKAGESKWKAYIDFLPKHYTTPLYFTISEMEFLKNTFIYEDSLKLYRNVARQYAYFSQILSNEKNYFEKTAIKFENFTFDLYRWATSTVMTRVNSCKNLPIMIPFLDMANHDPRLEESLDYDENRGKAVLYAARNYEKGQEIRIFYGKRTNGEFLLNNGFVGQVLQPQKKKETRQGKKLKRQKTEKTKKTKQKKDKKGTD
uniref:protein-histidine N-methyltransferase n=1 Tax=Romanomermis culicivorax TaxID=13658 RepID=A0A915HHU5_ROMCU